MAKKLKTNEDLVRNLMNYSPYGALCQAFIMEAIQRYAEALVREPLSDNSGAFFNPAAWNGIAADVKQRCDEFYGRHDSKEG